MPEGSIRRSQRLACELMMSKRCCQGSDWVAAALNDATFRNKVHTWVALNVLRCTTALLGWLIWCSLVRRLHSCHVEMCCAPYTCFNRLLG
jgi:hypothetical protein